MEKQTRFASLGSDLPGLDNLNHHPESERILHFWFTELEPRQHWLKDPKLDAEIKTRFHETLNQARACELFQWRNTSRGRLAEIIVLDQFSRNIHRETPASFIADPQALTLSQEALAMGHNHHLETQQKTFLYMPFMHSESILIQDESVRLFEDLGIEDNLNYAIKHHEVIWRFGRFPHRNHILGRPSTAEEFEFLKQPGSSF